MTKEGKKRDLRIIKSHLQDVMSDLCSTKCDLEELRCADLAKRLDTVCGRLYNLLYAIADKEAKL
jgi:hypothetical protein